MKTFQVEHLKINYKTLEQFTQFYEYGLQELSMLDDLRANLVENDSHSPFYGIYLEGELAARLSLYLIDAKYDRYFQPAQHHYEIWKLEVLPQYRGRGLGRALVAHAQSMGLPIKTNARWRSGPFWLKMGFVPVYAPPSRDRDESPYVWLPPGDERRD
ncbi:N-acetyltransferase [Laceyella tengchongensis]|uniref:N-acetyltransferase n=1 Tax=Laceyella tengchongensis TaxID=574699 RepID=UPI0012B9D009|nr:N-acetyltransferase [Laceyella tengchongensis]